MIKLYKLKLLEYLKNIETKESKGWDYGYCSLVWRKANIWILEDSIFTYLQNYIDLISACSFVNVFVESSNPN